MSATVKIIECPRDAWQGLQGQIPTDLKVNYLNALLSAGFKHIDAVSFVSSRAVPQMSDSDEVLKELEPNHQAEIIGIVVNEKGADRAIHSGRVGTVGFPYSVSPTFLARNQHQSPEQSLDELERIQNKAEQAGLDVVVYISMAFGNPYGDAWNPEEVVSAVELLEASGVRTISLADTAGSASPDQVRRLVSSVVERYGYLEIGVHLHSRAEDAAGKVLAAYDAGCRRFDGAIAGLGGCPFAQDALVGNIPTETLLEALRQRPVELPRLEPLDALLRASREIGARYSLSHAAD
ncbi:MAG: hydroxymethylglutaryl-CoA lyase [Acidobacteria bacterium]|nr:hydroxymethylglutaryl-CoA lyase [Acidobacteriota bacterium]